MPLTLCEELYISIAEESFAILNFYAFNFSKTKSIYLFSEV